MTIFGCILLIFLVVCAVAVSFSKNLLNSILIFMSYSLVMSIIWVILESPDLAITEAAVGAGVTTVLFLITLKKIHAIMNTDIKKKNSPELDRNLVMSTEFANDQEEVAEQDASEKGDLL